MPNSTVLSVTKLSVVHKPGGAGSVMAGVSGPAFDESGPPSSVRGAPAQLQPRAPAASADISLPTLVER